MQAGASILVVDVSHIEFEMGLSNQTKEHLLMLQSFTLTLNLVFALNKADKIEWCAERLNQIKSSLGVMLETLGFSSYKFIPVSAFLGLNLTAPFEEKFPCLLNALTKITN